MAERDRDVLSERGRADPAGLARPRPAPRSPRRGRAALAAFRRWATGATILLALVTVQSYALGGQADALILPSLTPLESCPECPPLERPDPADDPRVSNWARQLDAFLMEGARDLGLEPVSAPEPLETSGLDLTRLAEKRWVFSPRVVARGTRVAVRLIAVPPGSNVELTVTEEMAPRELEVRAMVMMRDVVRTVQPSKGTPPRPRPAPGGPARKAEPARSDGRAVLALNGAALGGYVGFTLQRAGGSNDARLTYPLIALGAGVGLGGSLIASEEWDVSASDAWYLSAGTWWPTLGGVLVARSYGKDKSDRYLIGLGTGAGGLALATTSLVFGPMSDGGAVMAHSGGAFGTALGALTEMAVEGATDETPIRGMGFGSMGGVLAAGLAARFLPDLPASRLLLIDLSAGIGGLAGAAVASPAVFGDKVSSRDNRIWLSSIASGIVLGAGVGVWVTHPSGDKPKRAPRKTGLGKVVPFGGAIASDIGNNPVLGAGAMGTW